jgi:hypothetical protein
MKEMRVVDTLGVLQQEGQIPKHLIASWKRLRNGFAHARSIDNNKIQETLDLLYAVSVLFYHLVFIVCEYEGKFTDHSQESFPTAIVTLPKH